MEGVWNEVMEGVTTLHCVPWRHAASGCCHAQRHCAAPCGAPRTAPLRSAMRSAVAQRRCAVPCAAPLRSAVAQCHAERVLARLSMQCHGGAPRRMK
eukprot:358722-Chlamydomonas_euryale.AAC.1